MKCPFLKDASVQYCEASAFRKLLLTDAISWQSERCATKSWVACPAARRRVFDESSRDRCPFLHDAQAEYCGAASVTKLIPATNDLLSRCNSDGHLYCEVYLLHADPQGERLLNGCAEPSARTASVGGIPVPLHLYYSPNHMWLDVSDDGSCHIGIDAFAAKVFGSVERVTFVPQRTRTCPTAVLRVNGVDVTMTFPEPHAVTANVYLRTSPAKLIDDPYGAGWLFECVAPATALRTSGDATHSNLLSGFDAVAWMREETRRLDEFAHVCSANVDESGLQNMADGGGAADGLAARLERDDVIELLTEFFTARTDWRRSS